MSAAFVRERFNIKEFGQTVTVPNSPTAKLMYYLDCVSVVLDLNDNTDMQRYRNYSNYSSMTTGDKNVIVGLCRLFDPRVLNDKVFFHCEDLEGNMNHFFEIGHVSTRVAAVEGLVIGGVTVRATKVMLYKSNWMKIYYIDAFTKLVNELTRPQITYRTTTTTSRKSDSCTIL